MALKQNITREILKSKLGDENIFRYYFGEFEFNCAYHSIFRKDEKKSTGFYVSENGSIIYNDLTTGKKYDFVNFVMELFGLSFYKAIEHIAVDFGLLSGSKDHQKKPVIKPITQQKVKPKSVFTVKTRNFTQKDLIFWKQFAITKKELVNNNIFSVKAFQSTEYVIVTQENELKFAYLFKDEQEQGYFKIYSPNSNDFKWCGNVPLNLPFGMETLKCTGDTLIITKSVKDCLVLRKFFPECIGLQNESKSSISKATLNALKKCYKNIIIFFDSDNPGKEAAKYYKENYNFETVFTPEDLYIQEKIKDPGDFVAKYGIESFKKYLIYIGLLK